MNCLIDIIFLYFHMCQIHFMFISLFFSSKIQSIIYYACKTYHLIICYVKIYQLDTLSSNPLQYIYYISTFIALINLHFYYHLLFNKLLPSLSRFPTQDAKQKHIYTFIGRHSIRSYYQNLEAIGQAATMLQPSLF